MLLFLHRGFLPRNTVCLKLYFNGCLQRDFSFSFSPFLALILSLTSALNILCWMFQTSNFSHCPGVSHVIGELLPREENWPASMRTMGESDTLKVGINFCSHYSRGK